MSNSITVTASDGTGLLEYSVDSGSTWQSSTVFSSLTDGNYNIFVRNTDQTCETPYINNPISFANSGISISITQSAPTCSFSTNGSININASGGSGGFIYSIDDGANFTNNSLISGLGVGLYNIKVRNTDGTCETDYPNNPVNLNTLALTLSASKNDATCPNSTDGNISLIGNGGSGNYEFSIDSALTWSATNFYQNLSTGNYYLFVRNVGGSCEMPYANNPMLVESGTCNVPNTCFLEYQLKEANGVYTISLKQIPLGQVL